MVFSKLLFVATLSSSQGRTLPLQQVDRQERCLTNYMYVLGAELIRLKIYLRDRT